MLTAENSTAVLPSENGGCPIKIFLNLQVGVLDFARTASRRL